MSSQTETKAAKAIAIAGSAGGIAAIRHLVSRLPTDLDAAVLVLIHLSPNYESRLDEVLRRVTTLKVSTAQEGAILMTGHVYAAPSGKHLVVGADRTLQLTEDPKRHYTRPSAEHLFESVAEAFGAASVLAIVTGGGRNGSECLSRAKELGATILVQDPREADQPSMPKAAIATGAVDEVLGLDAMSRRFEDLVGRTS